MKELSQGFRRWLSGLSRSAWNTARPALTCGVVRLLALLLRMGLRRDLATALEEDRIDLEERARSPRGEERAPPCRAMLGA